MRISTQMIYDQGVAGILQQQSALQRTQQQVSTGRRVVTPADDPIAAAQALLLTQADGLNTQFRVNRDYADSHLTLVESTLGQAGDVLQYIRELAVAAGNGVNTDVEHRTIAEEISGQFAKLVAIANSTDAEGQYLFSGSQANTVPFANSATGVQYLGDDSVREVQVGPSRRIAVNASGADAFMRVRNGNGTFVWSAGATNTGTGQIGPGSVANPALLTGDSYQINFTVAAGVTTYDVVDLTTATTIQTAQPYPGTPAAIAFDGIVVNLQGDPANGDSFGVVPSTNQSVFQTIQNLITALQAPASGSPAGVTRLANDLGLALTNLDRSMEQVMTQRVSAGIHLSAIDSLNSAGEDIGVQYQQARSNLVDLDYAKALSDLAREQTTLEAAQKSFVRITGLSLFDYL